MAVNKVVYDGNTLINLENDTVAATDVVSGKTFHLPSGASSTGSLAISHWYSGSGTPSSSLGANGDLYLMTG